MEENKNQISTNKIYYLLIFYIIYVIFDKLSKDYLKHISMKYFFSHDTTRCDYFIYSDYFEDGIKYLMYYIAYNFINLYCSIFMISIITLSTFITSNLKIIYKEVKPSLKHPEFPSCTTFSSFGTPSSTACSIFLLFGIFYQGMYQKRPMKSTKFFSGVLWFIFVFYACIVRMLQNSLYLNQVIYGLIIGFIIYYFFFEIIKIDFYDYSYLKIFLEYRWSCVCGILFIFFFNTFFQFILTKPYLKKNNNEFINQNYLSQTILFELLGYFMGILLEYMINFNCNDNLFCRYNVKGKNENEMFNSTKNDVSFFRLLLFCFSDYYLTKAIPTDIDFMDCSSYLNLLLCLPLINRILKGIILFFVLKYVIRFLGLSNEDINVGYFNSKKVLNKEKN